MKSVFTALLIVIGTFAYTKEEPSAKEASKKSRR
jgi:hypothetical protein